MHLRKRVVYDMMFFRTDQENVSGLCIKHTIWVYMV